MFRNNGIKTFPDFFYQTGTGDWVLHILNAQHGKIGFINEVMGVYRIHEGGTIYNALSSVENLRKAFLKDIFTFESIDKYLDFKFHKNKMERNEIKFPSGSH